MRSKIGAALAATLFWAVAVVVPAQAAFPGANGKIAFVRLSATGSGLRQILTVNPDGTGETPVTDSNAFDFAPAWSPDGKKVAFASTRGDPLPGTCFAVRHECNIDIFVANADGTGLTRLTDDPALDQDPAWSPDGSKIVWASAQGGQFSRDLKLWVMNADGSGKTQLTQGSGQAPNWSPAGSKVAFF